MTRPEEHPDPRPGAEQERVIDLDDRPEEPATEKDEHRDEERPGDYDRHAVR